MAQVLLNTTPSATINRMPDTIIHHQSKDSSWATCMLQSGKVPPVSLAELFDAMRLFGQESREPSDRSYNVDASSSEADSTITASTELQFTTFHHLSFFGKPVYHKCATPPATSLAILMSQKQGILDFDKCLRKAIIVWNTLCLLDPVTYWGPHDTLEKLRGTALKEAVTGQCAKLYTNHGTWHDDKWTLDEDEPFSYHDTAKTDVLFNGCRSYNISPSDQDFLKRLHRAENHADEVQSYMKRRENLLTRPRSHLRSVTCAADGD